jgi:hypothetical protein
MQSRSLLGGRPGRRSPRLFFASGPGLCFGLVIDAKGEQRPSNLLASNCEELKVVCRE